MPEQGSTGRSGLTNTEIVSRLLAYPNVLLQVTMTDDGYYRYFFGCLHENYSWGVYSRCLCDMLFCAVSCLNIIFISHNPLHGLCTQGPGCLLTAESPLTNRLKNTWGHGKLIHRMWPFPQGFRDLQDTRHWPLEQGISWMRTDDKWCPSE